MDESNMESHDLRTTSLQLYCQCMFEEKINEHKKLRKF